MQTLKKNVVDVPGSPHGAEIGSSPKYCICGVDEGLMGIVEGANINALNKVSTNLRCK